MSNDHLEVLKTKWLKPLNLSETPRSLAYLAEKITNLEKRLKGRLATSIEDAVLRILVTLSVQHKTLNVLEIGTLIGVGIAMIHDRASQHFEKIHLTAIDPLRAITEMTLQTSSPERKYQNPF